MTRRAALSVAMLAAILAGCATAELSLNPNELRLIRIVEVNVVYRPDFRVAWEAAEEEFVATQPPTTPARHRQAAIVSDGNAALAETSAAASARTELARSPAGQAFIRNKITSLIKSRAAHDLLPKFQGSRPVVVEVEMKAFIVPSAGQKIILGGNNRLGAMTLLKDAATGQVLGRMNRATGTMTGHGILGTLVEAAIADPPEVRLAARYLEQVATWLRSNP